MADVATEVKEKAPRLINTRPDQIPVDDHSTPRLQRPARVLLGWLDDEMAAHFLSGQRRDLALSEDLKNRIETARAAVAARAPGVDQTKVVRDTPADLTEHITALRQTKAAEEMFNKGWRVALVDLRCVCALQPHIFSDHAEERAAPVDPNDLRTIAVVTLPLPEQTALPAQFDNQRKAWIITAPNPNLRIVGNWGGPIQTGAIGFGFIVSILQSFLQVAHYKGRYVLRDGYHRAYALLRRGIELVPAFVREYGQFEELGLNLGLLPPRVYLGDHPPLLVDYSDEAVSTEVSLPAFQKMIIVHGLEITPLG